MRIEFENIVLRDMIESDIEDYVRWFTVEREWENWDAPWEKEDTNAEAERKSWTERYESRKNLLDDARRYRLEIEWNGRHIGSVNAYHIDENYEWIGAAKCMCRAEFLLRSHSGSARWCSHFCAGTLLLPRADDRYDSQWQFLRALSVRSYRLPHRT